MTEYLFYKEYYFPKVYYWNSYFRVRNPVQTFQIVNTSKDNFFSLILLSKFEEFSLIQCFGKLNYNI